MRNRTSKIKHSSCLIGQVCCLASIVVKSERMAMPRQQAHQLHLGNYPGASLEASALKAHAYAQAQGLGEPQMRAPREVVFKSFT